MLEEADARLQSWTFWDLAHFFDWRNPHPAPGCNGDPECRNLKFMARPYAQAVAGTPLNMRFDMASGVFTLNMTPDPAIHAPTEIFLPPHRYAAGYSVTIAPAGTPLNWIPCGAQQPNTICVSSSSSVGVMVGDALPPLVTVIVAPKV